MIEYAHIHHDEARGGRLIDVLSNYGKHGWELVSHHVDRSCGLVHELIFKRLMSEEEEIANQIVEDAEKAKSLLEAQNAIYDAFTMRSGKYGFSK